MMRATILLLSTIIALAPAFAARAAGPDAASRTRHHVELGFFDIHVCHWSDRPLFLMALFASTRFDEIAAIEILDPAGQPIGALDLAQYRLVRAPGQPEKRVFIRQFPVPAGARDGWYAARVTGRDGRQTVAHDFVAIARLAFVAAGRPAPDAEDIALPSELRWDAVPGAKHYQVFIHDLWESEKLIFASPQLGEPRLALPAGLLKPGGYYAWVVHARDVDGHALFGDFNHGSLGPQMKFSVAPR